MERYDMNNGRLGFSSVETLYSCVQKVYVKSKKGDEKSKMLRITIEIKSELAMSSGKVVCLQITEDNDCTFFFSLILTQEDFTVLKCQQGLLVDFDNFPSQLVKLLDICRSQDIPNKFILVLDEDDSEVTLSSQELTRDFVFLKVIETNNFKNLCHLSLKIRQGSDEDIKNHMSLKITFLNEKLAEETKKFKVLEINLNEALKALENKSKDLTELQLKVAEERNSLKLESCNQISEEREKLAKSHMEWQHRLDREKSQLVLQYQKQINDMNEQINLLTFNNKNLYESRCQLETSLKEKSFKIEAQEKQILQLSQEVSLFRKQSAQLDQDYHEKDKLVVSIKTKLAVIEQELKDKEKFLEKQQEHLKSATEQKLFLEEALNEKDLQLQRKQAAFQSVSSDLMKSNEIIAKLQTELSANKAKVKLRTDIALEQEKVLEKKNDQITIQQKTINDINEKMAKLTEELTATKSKLEEMNKQLEEKENLIKKNDNVINWLNRRLTESNTMNPTTSITSSRTENNTPYPFQSKGSIANLTKGWPPWLINSITGSNNSSNDSPGISSSSNGLFQPANNLLNKNLSCNDSSNHSSKLNECMDQDEKNSIVDSPITQKQSRGLDPKYFQCSVDKDLIHSSQLHKTCTSNINIKANTASKSETGRKPVSAYFPKKTISLI